MYGKNYIVVPDGLAADGSGKALPEPSFVYRLVLDWIVENIQDQDTVYLAPANKFGGGVSEQAAAKNYLHQKIRNTIISFESNEKRYIDTRGNAILLKNYLKNHSKWPLEYTTLISYHYHLPRARLVFQQEGFIFKSVAIRPHFFRAERIIPRLWYYQYPSIHKAYEIIAYCYYYLIRLHFKHIL